MRNAASHASALQNHSDILALQQMQLHSIQHDISHGNARLYNQLEDLKDHRNTSHGSRFTHEPQTNATRSSNKRYISSRKHRALRFRLPLLSWLAGRTWEIAVGQSQASWTLQIHPVNYRAPESLAFRYVREGNVTAVDKLLRAGELSIWDVSTDLLSAPITLLGVRVAAIVTLWYWNETDQLQLTVKYGQLELCDFLLTQFEPLRSDEQLHMAVVMVITANVPLRARYLAELFELFAGKFDMDVDVMDASPYLSLFLETNFYVLSEAILSHQSVDLVNWPLQERFRIAMRLEWNTPLVFQRTVGLPVSNRIAQMSDEYTGTCLHWALKEWFNQAEFSYASGASHTTGCKDHEEFVTALLKNKPLLHAMDKLGRTPLTHSLDRNSFIEEDDLWMPYRGPHGNLATLTEYWGRLLEDAGVSLPQYVARENALLKARSGFLPICLAYRCGRGIELRRFVLSEQQTLRFEVTAVTRMDIWEFRPTPGLFFEPCQDYSTILWPPNEDDGDRTCWQDTGSREMRSKPFQWTRVHELDTDEYTIFKALFHETHDDHSALALLLSRDRRKCAQDSRRPRKPRSSSMPPLGNACRHDNLPGFHLLFHSHYTLADKTTVLPCLHKCLFDSQWGFDVPDGRGDHSWRACMSGCQGRTDYSSLFEEFLRYTASEPECTASELERLERILREE